MVVVDGRAWSGVVRARARGEGEEKGERKGKDEKKKKKKKTESACFLIPSFLSSCSR